ncbi:MAG: hypothetical protein ACKPFA_18545 [Dolichospermum sp.]
MPLPSNFNEWEHLQDQIRFHHNKLVDLYFKNQANDDVSTPKASLKHACKIKDSDSAAMTQIRLWLFEVTAGHSQSLHPPIYGIPVEHVQGEMTFRPQVNLHFEEKFPYIANRIRPCEGQISFRIMTEDAKSWTRAKAEALAKDIKAEFGTPLFTWNKGKYVYHYKDAVNGYHLRLYVTSKTEGERIARAVLRIRNHAFNDDYSDYVENTRAYPNNPGNHIIYGKSVPKPIARPTVDVEFKYAQMLLHGRAKCLNLVSVRGTKLREVIEFIS